MLNFSLPDQAVVVHSQRVHSQRDEAYYRRLVYTGCADILSPRQSVLALKVWDTHFGAKRAFSAIRFARVCRSALSLDTETAKALTQKLTELSYQPDAELKEPPSAVPTRSNSQLASNEIAAASTQTAFKVLLGELLNAAWRERESLVPHLNRLSYKAKRMLLSWSAAAAPHLEVPQLSKGEMRKTIICLHVWLSERYSHAYADMLFERALKNTERLGTSFGFNVRDI